MAAITSPATGSAHDQPNALLGTSPTSKRPERFVHSKVCLESATALADPSGTTHRTLRV
jgi:hypothetical protein